MPIHRRRRATRSAQQNTAASGRSRRMAPIREASKETFGVESSWKIETVFFFFVLVKGFNFRIP